MGKWG